MEFISGISLKQQIKKRDISIADALDIIRKIVGIVKNLHEAGIIHRDIKPHNILIDKWQRIYLIDFGLVKFQENFLHDESIANTQSQHVMGTFPYMPPELLNGQSASLASDIYSLGVTFYELLAFELPIPAGPSQYQFILDVVHKTPPPFSQKRQDVPIELEKICLDMLSKKPQERPSIQDIFTRLQKIELATVSQKSSTIKRVYFKYTIGIAMIFLMIFFSFFKGKPLEKAVNAPAQIEPVSQAELIENLSTSQTTYFPGEFVVIDLQVVNNCFIKIFLISKNGDIYLFFPNKYAQDNYFQPGTYSFGKKHSIKRQVAWKADKEPGEYRVIAIAADGQFADIEQIQQQLQTQILLEVSKSQLQSLLADTTIDQEIYNYQVNGK